MRSKVYNFFIKNKLEFIPMKIETNIHRDVYQGAYYIESKGEVAIIVPLRKFQPYMKKSSEEEGTKTQGRRGDADKAK